MAKARKPAAKKAAPKRKPAAKKAAPKKAAAKKPAAKKVAPKKAAAKKPAAKKAAPKKAAPKKAAAKKPVARKTAAKKPAVKKAAPKPAPKAKKPAVPKGPYTKGDIVDHLAFNLDVTKKKANDFLAELTTLVSKNAKKEFTIPGLGKFHTVRTKRRNGRNPATGKAIVIPAKNKVKFRVGKALQDAVYPTKK